jgi:ubiquinone/menaquinone biosynthesis C-methylase UbiE
MFDEKYYKEIWADQGVHRHDYCESLANRLIAKYGKVRFLDIGTGCGELVRVLREKGCIAYGIDISEYAVANSHGNVLLGDVRDIPFKDNSFDVVFSQGLWEYVKEEEIDKAWAECNRVGKIQEHNIDPIGSVTGEEGFVNLKTTEEWGKRLQIPKVLVTCPVYDGKEYCFQKWIDMAKSLTYPNYDILVVDNSKTEDFYNKYKDQIPMIHKTFRPDEKDENMYRVCQSMGVVREHFLKGNYTHWMNIEADNIPPPNVIETLLKYGHDADWISHCYKALPEHDTVQQGIGCSLLSRKLMQDFDWSDPNIADDTPDSELWNFAKPKMRKSDKYKTVELWNVMFVDHLKP